MDQTVGSMNIGSIIRTALGFGAGIAVTHGVGTAETWQAVIGGLMAVGAIGWSWYKNRKHVATVKTALAMPATAPR